MLLFHCGDTGTMMLKIRYGCCRWWWWLLMIVMIDFLDGRDDDRTDAGAVVKFATAAFHHHHPQPHRRQILPFENNSSPPSNRRHHHQSSFFQPTSTTFLSSLSADEGASASAFLPDAVGTSSSLLSPLIDPTSDLAQELCINTLQLTPPQFQQILHFISLIMEWNERINLISRKDCSPSTIFTRHVLPSLVGGRIIQEQLLLKLPPPSTSDTQHTIRIMDVGTGGGFPGLPLSIQFPQIQFVLADSISKKMIAVQNMIDTLQLSNVQTYHGRVEDYFVVRPETTTTATTTITNHQATPKFDIVTGRSVTAFPQFCSWIQDLLVPDTGHLVYWMGGDIGDQIQEQVIANIAIQEHLSTTVSSSCNVWNDNFDKRVLMVPASGVRTIAASIPESQYQQQLKMTLAATPRKSRPSRPTNLAKGEWRKRNDPDEIKQRGYENFQRFTSSSSWTPPLPSPPAPPPSSPPPSPP